MKFPVKVPSFTFLAALSFAMAPITANAEIIGRVDFPQGQISFADKVELYNPYAGAAVPSMANADPTKALGAPQVPGNTSIGACTDVTVCPFVSLGDGGSIVLSFEDNLLTGSNDSRLDLWIFEVGPDVESTFIEISKDGITWHSVGKVFGTTAGIDIDAYGFTSSDEFKYIRLTDDGNEGGQTGASVGADIDAVGAISTVIAPMSCTAEDESVAILLDEARTEGYVDGYSDAFEEGLEQGYLDGYSAGAATVKQVTVVQYVEVPTEIIKEVPVEVIKEVIVKETVEVTSPELLQELQNLRARVAELEQIIQSRPNAYRTDHDNGHGNDAGKFDPSNPGNSKRNSDRKNNR